MPRRMDRRTPVRRCCNIGAMSRPQIVAATAAVMLSLFLASMEITIVGTAMPTIVAQLGGLATFSWVFSAYLLASTTTVPIYGKLSDLFGRRRIYFFAVALFLIGSVFAGAAASMEQLILARAVQGLGAGGILPLAFIIIGDMFSLEQRAKVQGLFSSVWGVSSIIGPLIGGFLVDRVGWPWVFYINLVPGLIAVALFGYGWRDARLPARQDVRVDFAGAILLSLGIVLLLLGLFQLGSLQSGVLIGAAMIILAVLVVVERRAADPVLPITLFRDRLFLIACLHGVLVGAAIFGSASFVPLFAQAVLGTTATAAGATLTPQMLSWVIASIICSRLLLRTGYRGLVVFGMVLAVAGTVLVLIAGVLRSMLPLLIGMGLTGAGMGFSIPAFVIAVQSAVQRSKLGTATSTLTFSRNIGGTLGVSIMGVILSLGLAAALSASGGTVDAGAVDALLEPGAGRAGAVAVDPALTSALAQALGGVFLFSLLAAIVGLLVGMLAPRGNVQQLEDQRQRAAREAEASHAQAPVAAQSSAADAAPIA